MGYVDLDSIYRASVGSIATAAWMDQINDNVHFLYGDAAFAVASLQNSWVAAGGLAAPPGYRLRGTTVELRGAMKSGTTTNGTTLFTLPVGYCPQYNVILIGEVAGGGVWTLSITTAGVVSIGANASATQSNFGGMSFSVL